MVFAPTDVDITETRSRISDLQRHTRLLGSSRHPLAKLDAEYCRREIDALGNAITWMGAPA